VYIVVRGHLKETEKLIPKNTEENQSYVKKLKTGSTTRAQVRNVGLGL